MEPTDAELIARTASEPEAFAAVFDRHYDAIFRYATARLGSTDGEEVAAQTFLEAFAAVARYDASRPDARPWLFGIATNLIRHRRRSRARSAVAQARVRARLAAAAPVDETEAVELADDARRLLEVCDRLPAAERDVLTLLVWADLSYAQIAAALGVPIGTVRSRLHRARRAVRAQLSPSMGGVV
jgi:RNA polymerase sigma factor (sigma-70 family)